MTSEIGIKKYIVDWLKGLGIGEVFQDREPWSDVTELSKIRTYVVVEFPDGIEDEGPWWYAKCIVSIGCRDPKPYRADMTTLDAACSKFLKEFPIEDDTNGVQGESVEHVGDGPFAGWSHECQYVFDVYAQKQER